MHSDIESFTFNTGGATKVRSPWGYAHGERGTVFCPVDANPAALALTLTTPQGMESARITLPKGGCITLVNTIGRGVVKLRFDNTPLFIAYSDGTRLGHYPMELDLPTPGVVVVEVLGAVQAAITIQTVADGQPAVTVIYNPENAPRFIPARPLQVRAREHGPSAVEGAPGINPRKEPVSVGMSYTDDELDALIVDAHRV